MVHRLSLQTMAVFYSSAPRSLDEPALKRPRTTCPAVHFKAMQLSWTSLALVGIDNHGKVSALTGRGGWDGEGRAGWLEERRLGGRCAPPPQHSPSPQLSLLRISPSLGHPLEPKLALQHLLFLLEYCMVTGYDWWDILLHVQPGMVQSLVERLHEEYTRQKPALQQVGGRGRRLTLPCSLGLWVTRWRGAGLWSLQARGWGRRIVIRGHSGLPRESLSQN